MVYLSKIFYFEQPELFTSELKYYHFMVSGFLLDDLNVILSVILRV